MSTPVLITDLDPVGTIDPANDLTIVHQGFTDKKATIAQVRNFDISLFSPLPNTAVNNDLFVISRGSTNYQIRFDQVSFVAGTQLWFYQDVAPSGWVTLPTGDCLLAVKGGSTYSVGGALPQGSWQQAGIRLDITQIPPHNHFIQPMATGKNNRGSADTTTWRAGNGGQTFTSNTGGDPATGLTQAALHDHGSTWRPLAATGILCQKQP